METGVPGAGNRRKRRVVEQVRLNMSILTKPASGAREGLTDWFLDRQAEVGYHFGHPQCVLVNALNSRF